MRNLIRSLPIASGLLLGSLPLLADNLVIIGDNSRGQTRIPVASSTVAAISAGREHVVALKRDGSISAWGYDGNGRASAPLLTNALSVSAGAYHSLALLGDGHVIAWGFNGEGLTTIPRSATNIIQISAGTFHNLALRDDGTILAWGYNGENRCVPPANLNGVVSLAAGRDHSVALTHTGQVVAWGMNDAGQASVPPRLSRVIAIAAGDRHTLALKSDGTVIAWGNNDFGQCTLPRGLNGVIAIAAGHAHSVALKSDGTVIAWGRNNANQTRIPSTIGQIIAISAGGQNTALLQADGHRIVAQPLSHTTLAGRDATFSVGAIGRGDFTYQWYLNGLPLRDNPPFLGATSFHLAISNLQKSHAGVLSVVVTQADRSVQSANALLIVRSLITLSEPRPVGAAQIEISFTDPAGEPLESDDIPLYQLQSSPDLAAWLAIDASIVAVNGQLVATLPKSPGPALFYRLVARE